MPRRVVLAGAGQLLALALLSPYLVMLLTALKPVGELRTADLLDNPDRALASLAPWVIRPRALTLTLWVRLLLCDLFVHGIGGAKYDRVTNDIFRTYYRCEPPAMACVSATLRLPLPRAAVQEKDHLASRCSTASCGSSARNSTARSASGIRPSPAIRTRAAPSRFDSASRSTRATPADGRSAHSVFFDTTSALPSRPITTGKLSR